MAPDSVMEHYIVWLEAAGESASGVLGAKADRLAAMLRSGFPVPPGFCLTTHAYEAFLAENRLSPATDPEQAGAAVIQGRFPPSLRQAISAAYHRLGAGAVAVRSSSTAEDLPGASFAGQQDSFLNVRGEAELLDGIRRCWASLWTDRVVAYRREHGPSPGPARMGVLVQAMIPADVAGVAFSVDPLTGAETVVIESAAGLGEGVAGGGSEVERYHLKRPALAPSSLPEGAMPRPGQLRRIAEAAVELERLFGSPQDVEWGLWEGKLYLFQSRPITASATGFFTETIPGDDHLWTAGFLNERFPQPVSPLGWTLVRDLLEALAFREPLRFMGYRLPAGTPVTKLYRGHPFVNVHVFAVFYKPFPRFLLPEDARRYFPKGDTGLRQEADYPCCLLDPRFVAAMLWHFAREPANWSPVNNFRHWAAFVPEHDQAMDRLRRRVEALDDRSGLDDAWRLIREAQALNRRLLSIHRWSLTHAEVFYSLLRRMLAAWFGTAPGAKLSAQLVAGLPNKSVELNRALWAAAGSGDWQAFMDAYGHRSFSLDIYHPTFAEMPDHIRRMASDAAGRLETQKRTSQRESAEAEVRRRLSGQRWGRLKARLFDRVLFYARRYMPLREDQRFYWQKTLALERRLALWAGCRFAGQGWLEAPDDIFFMTLEELRLATAGGTFPSREIARRRAEFDRLRHSGELAPQLSHPHFLRGNKPLVEEGDGGDIMHGLPVSPGLARGVARVISTPSQLDRLRPGDILITRGADPGWTVIFGRIAGLVTEVGGQLSHAAVVAREYGVPAVAGIQDATRLLKDGEEIVVDGLSGTVRRVSEPAGAHQGGSSEA